MKFKKIKLDNSREKASNEIYNWSLTKGKFLNVVATPYNSAIIFLRTILYFLENNKKILYITGEEPTDIDIVKHIKGLSNFRKYVYYNCNNDYKHALLIITTYDKALDLKTKFDLVIYDDINSFSMYSKFEIVGFMMRNCEYEGKLISYSIESIFANKKEIIIPIRDNKCPMVEPKFITTRIDICKDIPFVIYEYLKWSLKSNKKLIVYMPDSYRAHLVYEYMQKYCINLSNNKICYINTIGDKKLFYNFMKRKNGILFTNEFDDNGMTIRNINVMVFFASDSMFDYKKLIYFCGKVGRKNRHLGEAVFLTNSITEDMEKAKKIIRDFNKEAWEKKLLKL